jgi:hypothetical protein
MVEAPGIPEHPDSPPTALRPVVNDNINSERHEKKRKMLYAKCMCTVLGHDTRWKLIALAAEAA